MTDSMFSLEIMDEDQKYGAGLLMSKGGSFVPHSGGAGTHVIGVHKPLTKEIRQTLEEMGWKKSNTNWHEDSAEEYWTRSLLEVVDNS